MAEPDQDTISSGEAPFAPEANPRAKDPRALAREQLREIRSRLSQGSSIKPEFEYELLAMYARNELSARVTLPLLAVIFSLASMFWAPVIQASAWLTAVIAKIGRAHV